MKITDVKVIVIGIENPMGGGRGEADFVQVFTDEGIEGDYLASVGRTGGRGLADTIVQEYKPMLVGRNPFDREAILDAVVNRHTATVSMNAMGALDVALWDIAGKAAGLPIYRVLGGYRDKIRAYASTQGLDLDYFKQLVARGYTAIKLHPGGGAKEHVQACRATHDAVGDGVDLMRFGGQAEKDAVDPGRPEIVAEREEASLYVFDSGAPVAGPHESHRLSCPYRALRLRVAESVAVLANARLQPRGRRA